MLAKNKSRLLIGFFLTMTVCLGETTSKNATAPIAEPKKNETPAEAVKKTPKPFAFPDIQKIVDGGVLKVAVCKEERPPFYFTSVSGEFMGGDVDLAKTMASVLGVEVEFIKTAENFNDVVTQVSESKAHVGISKLSYTEDRSRKVIYSSPYVMLHVSLLVNRAQLDLLPSNLSTRDIFKKYKMKIAVVSGSSQMNTTKELFPTAEIVETANAEEANNLVRDGKCFARVSDDNELRKLLANQPYFNITCAMIVLEGHEDKIHVVIDPKLSNLYFFIQTMLNNKKEINYTVASLFNKFIKYTQK